MPNSSATMTTATESASASKSTGKTRKKSGRKTAERNDSDEEVAVSKISISRKRKRSSIKPAESEADQVTVEIVDQNTVTETLSETRQCFLGIALVSFATDNDLGRGPALKSMEINPREMNEKRLSAFIEAMGGNSEDMTQPMSNLARLEPDHAITILTESKFVDQTSLVRNPLDHTELETLRHVVWQQDANFAASEALIANGNGRVHFVREVLTPKKVMAKYLDALGKMDSDDLEESAAAKITMQELRAELDPSTVWVVAFYDLDKINASPRAFHVKQHLSSNAPIYQVPDSEDEALALLLNNLLKQPTEKRLEQLTKHRQYSLLNCSGPRRLPSTLKNSHWFLTLVELHKYSRHWDRAPVTVNSLYDWRTSVCLFLDAIVRKGTLALDFLVSNIPCPAINHPLDVSLLDAKHDLLDAEFFATINRSYASTLFAVRSSYGVPPSRQEKDTQDYDMVYAEYVAKLVPSLELWRTNRIKQIEKDFPALQSSIPVLDAFSKRLDYILTSKLFRTANIGMILPTFTPLLCPYFLADMADSVNNHKFAIVEVLRMVEPLYVSMLVETRGDAIWKDDAYGLLQAWIARKMAKKTTTVTDDDKSRILNGILSVIFQHRTYGVAKITALNKGAQIKHPSNSVLIGNGKISPVTVDSDSGFIPDSEVLPQIYKFGNILMAEWRKREGDITGHLRKVVPFGEKERLTDIRHGNLFVNILRTTALEWANCPTTRATKFLQTNATFAMRSIWVHLNHGINYMKHKTIWLMRQELQDYLSDELPGFKTFWDGVTEQPGIVYPPPTQDHPTEEELGTPRKLGLEVMASRMVHKSEQGLVNIARILCNPELGAIRSSDGFSLTSGVFDAVDALFQEVEAAVKIYRSKLLHPASGCTIFVDNLLCNFPPSYRKATRDEIEDYRDELGLESLRQMEVYGQGSAAQQSNDLRKHLKRLKLLGQKQVHAQIEETVLLAKLEGGTMFTLDGASDAVQDSEQDSADDSKEFTTPELRSDSADIDAEDEPELQDVVDEPDLQHVDDEPQRQDVDVDEESSDVDDEPQRQDVDVEEVSADVDEESSDVDDDPDAESFEQDFSQGASPAEDITPSPSSTCPIDRAVDESEIEAESDAREDSDAESTVSSSHLARKRRRADDSDEIEEPLAQRIKLTQTPPIPRDSAVAEPILTETPATTMDDAIPNAPNPTRTGLNAATQQGLVGLEADEYHFDDLDAADLEKLASFEKKLQKQSDESSVSPLEKKNRHDRRTSDRILKSNRFAKRKSTADGKVFFS